MNHNPKKNESYANTPEWRTARECHELLKQRDPGTRLSVNTIRRLAHDGKIAVICTGRRCLIDFKSLLEYSPTNAYSSSYASSTADLKI